MKFAFLLALLIALVAVSSATWTLTSTGKDVAAGKRFSFTLKTDAKISGTPEVSVPVTDVTTSVAVFNTVNVGIEGASGAQGSGAFCFAKGTKNVVAYFNPIAATGATALSFNVIAELAVDAEIDCTLRAVYKKPTGEIKFITAPAPGPVAMTVQEDTTLTWASAAPTIAVTDATKQLDNINRQYWAHSVTFTVGALAKDTLYGPITFFSKFGTETPYALNVAHSDWTVSPATGIRAITILGALYVITNDAAADATATFTADFVKQVAPTDFKGGEKYTIIAKIEQSEGEAKTANKELTAPTEKTVGGASILRDVPAAGKATWGCSFVPTADKGTFSLSITGYDQKAWTTGKFTADGKEVTLVEGQTSYPDLAVDKTKPLVSFTGTFDWTGEWTELATVSCSFTGSDDVSAKEAVTVAFKEVKSAEIKDDVLTYVIVVEASNTKYKGKVSGTFAAPFQYQFGNADGVADVRALDAYSPECSGASVTSKQEKDSLDLNRLYISSSVDLENGAATKEITCTQNLLKDVVLPGDFTILGKKVTAPKKAAITDKFTQTVTIKGGAIADSTALTALINKVIASLKADKAPGKDKFADLTPADFHYSAFASIAGTPVQHFGAAVAGQTVKFNTVVDEISEYGSSLTLVFNGKKPEDEETYVPVNTGLVYGADFNYQVTGTADDKKGFTDAVTFLDGTNAEVYAKTAFVQHGLGVSCNTSAQCASGYCNANKCVTRTNLTLAQQTALDSSSSSDETDSAMTAATVFAFALVVIALFF